MPAEEKEAEAEVGGGEKGGEQCTLPLYILPLDLPDDCPSFPNLPVSVVLVSLSLSGWPSPRSDSTTFCFIDMVINLLSDETRFK